VHIHLKTRLLEASRINAGGEWGINSVLGGADVQIEHAGLRCAS